MSCIVMHLLAFIYCFFPLLSPIDAEADAPVGYDNTPNDQRFAVEQQGKKNPFDHLYIAHSFFLGPALNFATVVDSSYSNA